ncbi:processed acidic surface protein [Bacillus andreraoultii]|uniref:processed acidic surface protein n=1 Tax=Bacillus andreraoultii TaxID=1499685 RepID=UPI00053B0D2C|nr:processed acidic surface protein [Bacillus andreraoultii]
MKKLGAIFLSVILLIGLFPQLSLAAKASKFDTDLNKYLIEISKVRGFTVTKSHVEEALAYDEMSLKDFTSVPELKDYLGEVIKSNLSNLNEIYEVYNLNQKSLKAILAEHGEEINDYIFVDTLFQALSVYTFERDPDFDKNLAIYLKEISETRGMDVSQKEIEKLLVDYEMTLEEFATIEELKEFFGPVIKADLSNLDYFTDEYGISQDDLLQLLKLSGDDINNYIFIDDLESTYAFELLLMDEEFVMELVKSFQGEFDLTDAEVERLKNHFMSIENDLAKPETIQRLEQLAKRMENFTDFEVATELSPQQLGELAAIWDELLSIFQLKAEYSLVKGGTETPISFVELLKLDELKNTNLKIALYNLQGEFLADLIITGEMVDSDTVNELGNNLIATVEMAKNEANKVKVVATKKKAEQKTVKGAKLPKTATASIPNALMGVFVLMAGILMFRKVRSI